jgi:serine/threonine protein kinase
VRAKKSLGDKSTIPASKPVGPKGYQKDTLDSTPTVPGHDKRKKSRARYQILEKVGEGGMGIVYKAQDNRLRRIVAIKRLKTKTQANQLAIARFLREARSIARLNHFNIVQIYDITMDTKGPYISMEFIKGNTLAERIHSKINLSVQTTVKIFRQVLSAVAFAHKQGIIHRDIKPSNIMIDTNDVPKLMDFGLAQARDRAQMTVTGAFMGTPDYTSPEQLIDPKNVDKRTDIYSLGAVMYECLTGLSIKYLRESKIPSELSEVVLRALAPNRVERYGSAEQMADSLEEICPSNGRRPTDINFEEDDILRALKKCHSSGLFLQPNIPERKLRNGIINCEVPKKEKILGFVDLTVWGSGKRCLLFGTNAIYYSNDRLSKQPGTHSISYSDLIDREVVEQEEGSGFFKGSAASLGGGDFIDITTSEMKVDALIVLLRNLQQILTE